MANVSPEMIRLLNSGDQKELRAFLKLYARPVYERALTITGNDADARRVTRRTISEAAMLAAKGLLIEDVDTQLMELTDACCSEDIFFAKLVDDTMNELAPRTGERAAPPVAYDVKPAAPRSAQKPAQYVSPMEPSRAPAPERTHASIEKTEQTDRNAVPVLFADEPDAVTAVKDDEDDEELELGGEGKGSPWLVVLIFVLSLVTVALVWVLLVKLMYLGLIPKFDFGFAEWFNANLFLLY